MRIWILALALAAIGCAKTAEPTAPLPSPPATAPTPLAPAPAGAVSPKTVVQHFDRARARELSAVLHNPTITVDQIDAIREADAQARALLTAMGKQGANVNPQTLHDARAAVRALEAAMEEPR
jgi:hypothetical protein